MNPDLGLPMDDALIAALWKQMHTLHNVGIACIDDALCIRLAGPGLEAFIEGESGQLVGRHLADVFVELFGAEQAMRAVLQGQEPEFYLSPIAREAADGSVRYLSISVRRLDDVGCGTGLLVVEDITRTSVLEQHLIQDRNEMRLMRIALDRANAELQRLTRFKSTMLTIAAHDLRSPLATMQNSLEILLEHAAADQLAPLWPKLLRSMLASVKHLLLLAAGLLDQEQAEQGQLALHPEPCDLVALTLQVIGMMRQELARRIDLDAPSDGLALVADPARLQQILYNLMDNAIKYTPFDLPIKVTISTEASWAVVRVRDQGRGMTPGQIAQLFQMYYRTEEARQGMVSGTGLGLFIVKALVEAHGGHVKVDSGAGQGTTVSIHLPRRQDMDQQGASS